MGLSLTGEREQRYRRLVIEVQQAVAKYVLGNIIISVLATIATWIVLMILGVPYALSLGIVVGFFDLLPLVGATLGAIVVALTTLTVDFPVATIVWIAFIIIWQRIEDYVVQPLVYGRALNVNPIVTILAVLIGASLLGILGALIAIPTAAAIQIVLTDWWRMRKGPGRGGRAGGGAGAGAEPRAHVSSRRAPPDPGIAALGAASRKAALTPPCGRTGRRCRTDAC
jgi:predicted PurR-regulated permease PerM